MAFTATALQVEFGRGTYGTSTGTDKFFRCASYITTDAPAVVEAANYFDAAAARLPKGTMIVAVMDAGGTPKLKQYVVTANTGTAVTIALQTATAG